MSSLLQIGIHNAVVASLLAAVVFAVTRRTQNAAVVHVLWLLVLLKLLMPPLVDLPIPPQATASPAAGSDALPDHAHQERAIAPQDADPPESEATKRPIAPVPPASGESNQPEARNNVAAQAPQSAQQGISQRSSQQNMFAWSWTTWIISLWLLGSLATALGMIRRIADFRRILRATALAPDAIQQLARRVQAQLYLRANVEVRLTSASIPPILWSLGRKKLVVLPAALVRQLDEEALETVLTHELAHVRRRDHLVRWIEVATAVLYWWLPTVWWVRRKLREAEEEACDAWVVTVLPHRKHAYATALVQAVETLARSRTVLPGLASGFGEGRQLIRRIERLTEAHPPRLSRPRKLALAAVALAVLPLSLSTLAADDEPSEADERAPSVRAPAQAPDAEPADEAPLSPLQQKRQQAVQRGVQLLKSEQDEEGNWSDPIGFEGGMTALCTLALLEAGLAPEDEAVARALAWLRDHDEPEKTYVVSLVTRVYAAAGLPEDRGRIKRNADWLASTMIEDGPYRGCWGYQEGAQEGDNSNAQYAMLGLEAAELAGVEIPEGIWRAAHDYWLEAQSDDGSWGYKPGVSGTGSMTASGIASLAIALSRADYTDRDAEREAAQEAIDQAFDWFAEHYSIAGNPVPEIQGIWSRWHYYYLAALSYGCRHTDRGQIGDHDFRQEAIELLLDEQRQDGSWSGAVPEDNAQMATALALLVLQIASNELPAAAAGAGADANAPAPRRPRNFHVGDLREIPSHEDGAVEYRLTVDAPKGTRFRVTLREALDGDRNAAIHTQIFEKEEDGPVEVNAIGRYSLDHNGPRDSPVLLGQSELMAFDVSADQTYPGGVALTGGVPLNEQPSDQKRLVLLDSDDPRSMVEGGRRLLLILPKDKNPETAEQVQATTPRGELLVTWEEPEQPEPRPTAQERVLEAWGRIENGIGTSHIVYTRLFGGDTMPLTPAELQKELALADLELHPEKILQVVPRLVADEDRRERLLKDWGTHTFRSVGLKTIQESREFGRLLGVRWADGELDLNYDPGNGQCEVYRAGDSPYGRVDFRDFVHVPGAEVLDRARLTTESSLVDLLAGRGREDAVADEKTGMIRWRCWRTPAGETRSEKFQFAPQTHPSGITLPTLKIDASYRGGKLDGLQVILIKELHINEGFEDEAFQLTLPGGTRLIDYRRDTFRPTSHRLTQDVADAATYIRRKLAGEE